MSGDWLMRFVVTSVARRRCPIGLRGRGTGGPNHLRRWVGGLLIVPAIAAVEILTTVSTLRGKCGRCIVTLNHGWWARVVGPCRFDRVIDQNGRLTSEGLGVEVINVPVSLTALMNVINVKNNRG